MIQYLLTLSKEVIIGMTELRHDSETQLNEEEMSTHRLIEFLKGNTLATLSNYESDADGMSQDNWNTIEWGVTSSWWVERITGILEGSRRWLHDLEPSCKPNLRGVCEQSVFVGKWPVDCTCLPCRVHADMWTRWDHDRWPLAILNNRNDLHNKV